MDNAPDDALCSRCGQDADLRVILDVWPTLSSQLKAAIIKLVIMRGEQ
jgi:hypothetical protein